VLFLIPILVIGFSAIHRHYRILARSLSLKNGSPARISRHRVIMLVSGVHQGTIMALNYSRLLSNDITAVHVSTDPDKAAKLRREWEQWGNSVRLVILSSPYRLLLEPLLEYIQRIDRCRQPGEVITIVVPQFVAQSWWHNLLHTQTAFLLRLVLLFRPGIVIVDVPYQIE
jgi:hypothetical protein